MIAVGFIHPTSLDRANPAIGRVVDPDVGTQSWQQTIVYIEGEIVKSRTGTGTRGSRYDWDPRTGVCQRLRRPDSNQRGAKETRRTGGEEDSVPVVFIASSANVNDGERLSPCL